MILIVLLLAGAPEWRTIDAGVEYALVESTFHVVRIDASKAKMRLVTSSKEGVAPRTAGEWADDVGLVVAINAGMFQTDHKRNVGYARDGEPVNNGRWNEYQSILAWKSRGELALADKGTIEPSTFDVVIQNLRLIKGAGQNDDKRGGGTGVPPVICA